MVTATGLRQLGALAAVLGHWTQSLVLPLTVPDPDVPPAWPNSRPTRGQEWPDPVAHSKPRVSHGERGLVLPILAEGRAGSCCIHSLRPSAKPEDQRNELAAYLTARRQERRCVS